MNILFYDPTIARHEYNEPYALEVLSASIKAKYQDVNVKIKTNYYDGMLAKEDFDIYDMIGISLTYYSLKVAEILYSSMTKYGYNGFVVFGNSLATFAYRSILSKFPKAICCVGEGELFYEDFLEYAEGNLEISQIRNAAYVDGTEIILNKRCVPEIKDIVFPKVHENLELMTSVKRENGTFRIEGSRGCSWGHCTFCYVNHKYVSTQRREFPIESVIKRIIELSDFGVINPYFTDDDFIGSNYDRIDTLCKQIIDLKHAGIINDNIEFFISIKASDILNERWKKTSKLLYNAGFTQLFIGIESGSSTQLKRYGKGNGIESTEKAMQIIQRQAFSIDIGFIFFDPFVKYQELIENLKFIERYHLYSYRIDQFDDLRVTPYTNYEKMCEGHVGDLNIENLSYAYKFRDPIVDKIFSEFLIWKNRSKFMLWEIELDTRGDRRNTFASSNISILNYIEYLIMVALIEYYDGIDSINKPIDENIKKMYCLYEKCYEYMIKLRNNK